MSKAQDVNKATSELQDSLKVYEDALKDDYFGGKQLTFCKIIYLLLLHLFPAASNHFIGGS